MAARSAASRGKVMKSQCISSMFRCGGAIGLHTTNPSACQKTANLWMTQTTTSTANLASKLQNELILSPPVSTNGRSSPQENNVDCNATVIGAGMFKNNLPEGKSSVNCELPGFLYKMFDELVVDDKETKEEVQLSSVLKKRRKKMNKHKYKKRIHRDKAKINSIKYFRLRRKRKKQAFIKRRMMRNIKRNLEDFPNSDYTKRSYVVFRLKNW